MNYYAIGIVVGVVAIVVLMRELLLQWHDVRRQRRLANELAMREAQ